MDDDVLKFRRAAARRAALRKSASCAGAGTPGDAGRAKRFDNGSVRRLTPRNSATRIGRRISTIPLKISFDDTRICLNEDCVRYGLESLRYGDSPTLDVLVLLRGWLAALRCLQPGGFCFLPYGGSHQGYDLDVIHCFQAERVADRLVLECVHVCGDANWGVVDFRPPTIHSFAFSSQNITHRYPDGFGSYPFQDFVSALEMCLTTPDKIS